MCWLITNVVETRTSGFLGFTFSFHDRQENLALVPSWATSVESSRSIPATVEEYLMSGCTSVSLSNADTSGKVRRWKLGGGDHHEERLEVSFLREKSQNQIQVIIMTYHFFLTRNLPEWRRWGADIQKQMWPSLNICYSCSVGWLPNEKESHFYALTSLGPYGVVQLSGY